MSVGHVVEYAFQEINYNLLIPFFLELCLGFVPAAALFVEVPLQNMYLDLLLIAAYIAKKEQKKERRKEKE